MTKKKIIKEIAKRFGLTEIESNEIVNYIFELITDELLLNRNVKIENFATFYVKKVKRYITTNFKHRKREIKTFKAIRVKFSKKLKQKLNK